LPIFERLLGILDGVPGKITRRTANPFFYAGLATRYETERLSEDDRDNLPERINYLRPKGFADWLSEREWIPIMMETADQPRKLLLKLDANETNIDYLEKASCEEIFGNDNIRNPTASFPRLMSFALAMAMWRTGRFT
jgi:hypothetical protein